jgi:hypothetical protein
VTQPLYSSSVARWKHYASEFAPIAETLRPYIKTFGYEAFETTDFSRTEHDHLGGECPEK